MKRIASSLVLMLLVASAWAEERFPPPDFSPGYVMPATTTPAVRALWLSVLDVGLLAVALGLTGWAVLVKRSRTATAWIAFGSLVWFGFVRNGCVCSIGSIQDVAHAGLLGGGLSWVAAAFFLIPLAVALFAGRLFCAGVCPLGAIQDLVLIKPIKLPPWLEGPLTFLPYVYLTLAVLWAATGAAYIICSYDPFVGFFRLTGPASMLIAGGALLAVATVVGRPYCRFLCPYGVLLSWVSPLAKWQVRIHPTACVGCRLCEESCPFGAMHTPTPTQPRKPSRALLAGLILATVPLLALGAWLGNRAGDTLARQHATVALADRLLAEDAGTAKGASDAADAVRRHNRAPEEIHAAAATIVQRTRVGAAIAGGFLVLVLMVGLIRRVGRNRQTTYQADPRACVSCARCLPACPGDEARPPFPVLAAIAQPQAVKAAP